MHHCLRGIDGPGSNDCCRPPVWRLLLALSSCPTPFPSISFPFFLFPPIPIYFPMQIYFPVPSPSLFLPIQIRVPLTHLPRPPTPFHPISMPSLPLPHSVLAISTFPLPLSIPSNSPSLPFPLWNKFAYARLFLHLFLHVVPYLHLLLFLHVHLPFHLLHHNSVLFLHHHVHLITHCVICLTAQPRGLRVLERDSQWSLPVDFHTDISVSSYY